MFPKRLRPGKTKARFLRASGGVSFVVHPSHRISKFSPRKRRCFCRWRNPSCQRPVFSAQAEVFLRIHLVRGILQSFLRASGGVSGKYGQYSVRLVFSPRKRRCFQKFISKIGLSSVFSAQAEVFPYLGRNNKHFLSFLRASGGVSSRVYHNRRKQSFSPRKRRCFFLQVPPEGSQEVFSAQAEVFLAIPRTMKIPRSFLRASGGVSKRQYTRLRLHEFSPRKRRCFSRRRSRSSTNDVFSAQAEVFPPSSCLSALPMGFLRASGGVS